MQWLGIIKSTESKGKQAASNSIHYISDISDIKDFSVPTFLAVEISMCFLFCEYIKYCSDFSFVCLFYKRFYSLVNFWFL